MGPAGRRRWPQGGGAGDGRPSAIEGPRTRAPRVAAHPRDPAQSVGVFRSGGARPRAGEPNHGVVHRRAPTRRWGRAGLLVLPTPKSTDSAWLRQRRDPSGRAARVQRDARSDRRRSAALGPPAGGSMARARSGRVVAHAPRRARHRRPGGSLHGGAPHATEGPGGRRSGPAGADDGARRRRRPASGPREARLLCARAEPSLGSCTSPSSAHETPRASSWAGESPVRRGPTRPPTRWIRRSGPAPRDGLVHHSDRGVRPCRFGTANTSPPPASRAPSGAWATATTRLSPNRSPASTRPRSSGEAAPGRGWKPSSGRPSTGSTGSMTPAGANPSDLFPRRSSKRHTTNVQRPKTGQRDSSTRVSDEVGVVHRHLSTVKRNQSLQDSSSASPFCNRAFMRFGRASSARHSATL